MICRAAKIGDFVCGDPRILGPLDRHIGRADQRFITLIGDREHDPPVRLLQHIGLVAVEQLGHDDVAALDQPDAALRVGAGQRECFGDPGAGGIDHRPGLDSLPVGQGYMPQIAFTPRSGQRGAGKDLCAMLRSINRVQHHQPRVIDPGIRIDEAFSRPLQRREIFRIAHRQPARPRQADPPADRIVKQQPHPHEPPRANGIFVRQYEVHRPDQVRCRLQQALALLKRLTDQLELVIFEIA